MALVSAAFGLAVSTDALARRITQLVPLLGVAGVAFGCWYALAAV
jgi:hypothetical protein